MDCHDPKGSRNDIGWILGSVPEDDRKKDCRASGSASSYLFMKINGGSSLFKKQTRQEWVESNKSLFEKAKSVTPSDVDIYINSDGLIEVKANRKCRHLNYINGRQPMSDEDLDSLPYEEYLRVLDEFFDREMHEEFWNVALMNLEEMQHVESFNLVNAQMGKDGASAIARSPNLKSLKFLTLSRGVQTLKISSRWILEIMILEKPVSGHYLGVNIYQGLNR